MSPPLCTAIYVYFTAYKLQHSELKKSSTEQIAFLNVGLDTSFVPTAGPTGVRQKMAVYLFEVYSQLNTFHFKLMDGILPSEW